MSPKAESLLFCLIQHGLLGRHFFLNCEKKMVSSLPSKIVIKKKMCMRLTHAKQGLWSQFYVVSSLSALIYSHQGEEKKWIDLCIVGPGKPGGGPASKSHKKTVGSQFRKKSSTDFIDFINFFFHFLVLYFTIFVQNKYSILNNLCWNNFQTLFLYSLSTVIWSWCLLKPTISKSSFYVGSL